MGFVIVKKLQTAKVSRYTTTFNAYMVQEQLVVPQEQQTADAKTQMIPHIQKHLQLNSFGFGLLSQIKIEFSEVGVNNVY